MIDHLWQSTWFGIAVWLMTLGFRGNRASVRHWLWFSASRWWGWFRHVLLLPADITDRLSASQLEGGDGA